MEMKRARMGVALIAVVTLGALVLWRATRNHGTFSSDSTTPIVLCDVVKAGAAAGFNVLLVTLDTTRPDHLGCYGHANAMTPNIDSLVGHGVRFDDVTVSVPITLPSHSTIMTGLDPPMHGARANGAFRLGPEVTTLAELLKQEGYDTGGFVSSFVLDSRFGIDQGFDYYDFKVGDNAVRQVLTEHNERRADDTTASFLKWFRSRLDSGTTSPFFAWIHYYDPHSPYDSPLQGLRPELDGRPYDAEIAFVDLHLGRVLSELKARKLYERTLIVVTTDHGEALMEHEEPGHSLFIYESTMRGALIVSCPSLFRQGYRVDDRLVGVIDVTPTILAMLGIDHEVEMQGLSLLDPAPSDREIYTESYYVRQVFNCAPLYGLRRHVDKFILAPRPEYYDLSRDPGELDNLYDRRVETSRKLESSLQVLMAAHDKAPSTIGASRQLAPEDRERLAGLGYLDSTLDSAPQPCDAKDEVELLMAMNVIKEHLSAGRYDEALERCRALAAENPDWDVPVMFQAQAFLQLKRWPEAAAVLEQFVRRRPNSELIFRLAWIYFQSGNDQALLETLDAAEALDPLMGAIPMLRGDYYVRGGQYAKAIHEYERALEIDGDRVGPDVAPKLKEARQRLP
ncbi:MAG: tetratricopeptide repeat protein [Phycisphaerales bacterium]|nr:tetratricopeptide repeat protein [Phycisphaerales bacterium]